MLTSGDRKWSPVRTNTIWLLIHALWPGLERSISHHQKTYGVYCWGWIDSENWLSTWVSYTHTPWNSSCASCQGKFSPVSLGKTHPSLMQLTQKPTPPLNRASQNDQQQKKKHTLSVFKSTDKWKSIVSFYFHCISLCLCYAEKYWVQPLQDTKEREEVTVCKTFDNRICT